MQEKWLLFTYLSKDSLTIKDDKYSLVMLYF